MSPGLIPSRSIVYANSMGVDRRVLRVRAREIRRWICVRAYRKWSWSLPSSSSPRDSPRSWSPRAVEQEQLQAAVKRLRRLRFLAACWAFLRLHRLRSCLLRRGRAGLSHTIAQRQVGAGGAIVRHHHQRRRSLTEIGRLAVSGRG